MPVHVTLTLCYNRPMNYAAIALIGLSLSMDAFAVAITIGICRAEVRLHHALKVALFFGGFQALMPTIGFLAGRSVAGLIKPFDHWVAFALLFIIGGHMIYSAFHEKAVEDDNPAAESCPREDPTGTKQLLLLAVATSIDALAAGISLALDNMPIVLSAVSIGVITAVLSAIGVLLGRKLGVLFQKYACIVGGIVLILIGIKILAEHLIVT
jgi:putative Mn2+ efflux pump MntP